MCAQLLIALLITQIKHFCRQLYLAVADKSVMYYYTHTSHIWTGLDMGLSTAVSVTCIAGMALCVFVSGAKALVIVLPSNSYNCFSSQFILVRSNNRVCSKKTKV